MIRIHLTAADWARTRFAARPAPLQELNAALLLMCRADDGLLVGRWRHRLLRTMPGAVRPLRELVPAADAPAFLDGFGDSLAEALDEVAGTPPALVRAEIERVHAGRPAPLWVRDLHRGEAEAWRLLRQARQAAFEAVLRPVWPLVQDLHAAEFARHAVTVAEHGLGAALDRLVPGARLRRDGSEDVWEFDAPGTADLRPRGRGLVLLPTFHWDGWPLVSPSPDGPVVVTYPAGTGTPPAATDVSGSYDALSAVLGRTRVEILRLLADERSTSGLASRLGVSNATVSAHTAALRGAGLITTSRAGRAVLHRRTPVGRLLLRRHAVPD